MIAFLKALFGKSPAGPLANPPKRILNSKRLNSIGDFRAVEIAPGAMCCTAAKRAMGKSYLLRAAPRLPLMGCTTPTNCSCRYLKNADRRESDRRLFGATETKRWFAGLENRKLGGRRSVDS